MNFCGSRQLNLVYILIFLFAFSVSRNIHSQNEIGFASVVVSDRGLSFLKDLFIKRTISSISSLQLPSIKKTLKIPLIGAVHVVLSDITFSEIDVPSSIVEPSGSGITVVASGANANLSMNWFCSYNAWIIPINFSDRGRASVQVDGMEVGFTIGMVVQNGTLKLSLIECGCYVEAIVITLHDGASWLYQGLVDAFEGQIRAAVENVINGKIREEISKLDIYLHNLPREIYMDETATLNVTFVNEPLLLDNCVGLEINGLFVAKKFPLPMLYYNHMPSPISCNGTLKMLEISLDEAVFNSASVVHYEAGLMDWVIDKVSVQPFAYLLNTAGWKYIIPQLYRKYPNDDMQLNISLTSPLQVALASDSIVVIIPADMIIEVVDKNETIPVACIFAVKFIKC